MTADQRLAHAELVHGLVAFECATCSVTPDRSCPLCGGEGVYYRMDCQPCGRSDCPIGRRPS